MEFAGVDSVFEIVKRFSQILTTPFLELSGNKISITTMFIVVLFIYLSSVLSKYAQVLTTKVLMNKNIDSGVKGSITKFIGYATQILGIVITLEMVGISLSSIFALGGVLMVGIGFGLQNITQNFISGVILLFERPIKKGDLVEVDGVSGRVTEIGSRSTTITTRDDVSIIVPNSKFISQQVVNDSFSGERRRFHVAVGVAYGSDVDRVQKTLIEVAKNHSKVLDTPAPRVFFQDFGDSSLNFDLTIWVEDLWNSQIILSDLRFEIDRAFRKNEIEIPFPQRDLHLRSSNVDFRQ